MITIVKVPWKFRWQNRQKLSYDFLQSYCFSIFVPDIDDVMSKKRNSIVKSSGEGEKERSRVLPWKFTPFPTFVARAALLYSSYRNCSKVETRGQWMMAPGSRVAKDQLCFDTFVLRPWNPQIRWRDSDPLFLQISRVHPICLSRLFYLKPRYSLVRMKSGKSLFMQ